MVDGSGNMHLPKDAGGDTGRGNVADGTARHRAVIVVLKIIIVLIALVLLSTQIVFLPLLAEASAENYRALAYLRVPYLILAIGILCCFEVVLGALWRLLSMTDEGRVFNRRAFRWVDVIIWAAGVSALLTGVLLVHHALIVEAGPLLLSLSLAVVFMAEIGGALLVSVMRSLLVVAISQHDELETVI